MDHVIEYILDYMEHDAEVFRNEWTSGEYSKIAECPTYETIKAYCDAIKVLNRMEGMGDIHQCISLSERRKNNGQMYRKCH